VRSRRQGEKYTRKIRKTPSLKELGKKPIVGLKELRLCLGRTHRAQREFLQEGSADMRKGERIATLIKQLREKGSNKS